MKAAWKITKLGDLLDVQNGYAFDSKGFSFSEGTPLIRIRDLRSGCRTESRFTGDFESKYIVQNSDLLIGMDGEFGCYEWTGGPALLNQRVCRLQNFRPELIPRFLFYGLNRHLRSIEDATSYLTVKHLSSKQILNINFPLPSLPEQQRILAVLDRAFATVATAKANTEKNLQNARALFESYFESTFTQRGKQWIQLPLSELCEVKHGFAFKSEFFSDDGVYVLLTPGNFYEHGGYRDRRDKQKFYVGEVPSRYILRKGDLLVAMTEQAPGLLGSPILVPESDRFLHNQRLGLVVPKPGVPWSNDFFFHIFNTKAVRKGIYSSGSGVKVRHTSPTKIGDTVVSFPGSMSEQRATVLRLNQLYSETQRLRSIYLSKFSFLEQVKASLLHQAFSGNL